MAFWNRKKDADQPTPEVTPAPPIVTPEEKQPQAEPAAAAPAEPAQTEKKRKRRGQPQDFSKLTRNSQVKIRLTEEEVSRLKAAAAEQHMSLADFVMAGVSEPKRIVIPGGGQIRTELFRQGKNLNYALMLCNTAIKQGQRPDLQAVTEAAAKVSQAADQLAELVLKWDAEISEKVDLPKKEVPTGADRQV